MKAAAMQLTPLPSEGIMALERHSGQQTKEAAAEGVSVEQFVSLAQTLVAHPELFSTFRAIAEKIEVARRQRWTGKLEIDIQTGEVRGGPTIKAV
jgi:2-oxoglutarate dehydrogenase complex dehydrogenase (E1) component-like enzyme